MWCATANATAAERAADGTISMLDLHSVAIDEAIRQHGPSGYLPSDRISSDRHI